MRSGFAARLVPSAALARDDQVAKPGNDSAASLTKSRRIMRMVASWASKSRPTDGGQNSILLPLLLTYQRGGRMEPLTILFEGACRNRNVLTGFVPASRFNRLAHAGHRLGGVPGVLPRRVNEMLEPGPLRQSIVADQGLFESPQ